MTQDDRTPEERLEAAVEASGLSHTEIARQMAGPGADKEAIAKERRGLLRWIAGTHMPNVENATKLARVLGGDPGDYRMTPKQLRATILRRLRRTESAIAEIREELP